MRIVIIGSGNVATHLACGLFGAGHEIAGVFSRTPANASALAAKVRSHVLASPAEVASSRPDVVLLSLADSCAREVIDSLPPVPGAVVLHTSGTLPQEILLPLGADAGILYPLQTFSKNVPVDLATVPFFVEGTTPYAADVARRLAGDLSRKVHYADAEKRKILHIAGVLSCNFPNYLWDCCRRLLEEAGYPLGVVEPLVRATVDKAFAVGPHEAQTGPARRNDTEVIAAHVKALPAPLADIYQKISDEIIKSHYEQNSV